MDPSSIINTLSSFSPEDLKSDEAARQKALGLSRMLISALQDPIAEATEIMIAVRVA